MRLYERTVEAGVGEDSEKSFYPTSSGYDGADLAGGRPIIGDSRSFHPHGPVSGVRTYG